MAEHDLQDLTKARKVLVEMRYTWIKAIAANKDTKDAIAGLIEVQQAIDVIDHAVDELEDVEDADEE
jgi:hypothetical protein